MDQKSSLDDYLGNIIYNFLSFLLLLIIFSMLIIIPISIEKNHVFLSIFQVCYLFVAGLIFVYRKKIKSRKMIGIFILLPSYALTLFALFNGNQDTFHWIYIFPVVTFFLLGYRTGLIVNTVFYIATGYIAFISLDKFSDSYTSLTVILLSQFLIIALSMLITYTREKIQRLLHKNMITDSLTNIHNRQHFTSCIKYFVENFHRYRDIFSLVLFDIDKFKDFNDTYGHNEGDKLLNEISILVKTHLRNSDQIFRVGGEEFAILLPHMNKEKSFIIAERIRESVEKHSFCGNKKSTISMGVSEALPELTVEKIYCQADTALYSAKNSGRNQTCIS